MAFPGMTILPIIVERIQHQPWFAKYPKLHAPFQVLGAGGFLVFMVPIACGLYPQKWRLQCGDTKVGHRGYGDRLVQIANFKNLKIGKPFFKKQPSRKWKWVVPNGVYKNEIGFVLKNKTYTITEVSVLNQFNTGSDHRPLRATIAVQTGLERTKLVRTQVGATIDTDKLTDRQVDYREKLRAAIRHARGDTELMETIRDCAVAVALLFHVFLAMMFVVSEWMNNRLCSLAKDYSI